MGTTYPLGSTLDLRKIPVLGLVPEISPTNESPASPANGQLWFDSTVGRLCVREGSQWVTLSNVGVELVSERDTPNGHPGLDSGGLLSLAQIPTITDVQVASANKDGLTTVPSLRTLGTGAQQALPGNAALDALAAPNTPLNLNGQRVTNLGPSSSGMDAVNRNELELARQGYAGAKDPVRVVSTVNVSMTAPGASVGGVALTSGDRILLKAQSVATQNGIYTWSGSSTPLVRATDADATGEIKDGTTVAVSEGTFAGSVFVQVATPAGSPGAWTQSWIEFNTVGTTYNAGGGLFNDAGTFNVVGTPNRIVVNPDSVDIAPSYLGQTSIVTLGSVTTGTWNATPISLNRGGTGGTDAPTARAALGTVGRFSMTLGDLFAGVETVITHGLASTEVLAGFRDATTDYPILLSWRVIDSDTVGVTTDLDYSSGNVKVVVMG